MKKRLLYHQIIKQIDHKNAIVITGMRQVGKTSLLRQIYEAAPANKLWFDFENPLGMRLFEDVDYDSIYQKLLLQLPQGKTARPFIFIDEIQFFPQITKIIKYFIDHYRVKFFVTGSSSFYLKNLFPESLSGRKFLYTLPPLSFAEYLFFNDVISEQKAIAETQSLNTERYSLVEYQQRQSYYADYLAYGGFPEVVVTPDAETKAMILQNIFTSFFEKDIGVLTDYKDVRELRDLLLLLVPRVGSILQITKLASELSVDRAKIYSYLEFLVGAFVIQLVPKYTTSVDRAVAGGKRCYFTDNGILKTLGSVNEGQLFENGLHAQLMQRGALSFYNSRSDFEIDFILNKKIALEAKLFADARDVQKLRFYQSKLGLPAGFVVSQKFVETDGVIFGSQL